MLGSTSGSYFNVNAGTSGGEQIGGAFQIGDGFALTAGHIIYEHNERFNAKPSRIGISNIIGGGKVPDGGDYRGYRDAYAAAAKSFWSAPPAVLPVDSRGITDVNRAGIENKLYEIDTVVIRHAGQTTSRDAGLVVFLTDSDMIGSGTLNASMGSSSSVVREGATTGSVTGNILSANAGSMTFDVKAEQGDSGGAYLLKYGGQSFVIGTQSSTTATRAYGTYFLPGEWDNINDLILANQSGNISIKEPTNLVVGTTAIENIFGSLRADIILARGGADTLNGGDALFSAAWGNDQLYGGADDDKFVVGRGSNLYHGGDRLVAQADTRTALNADGNDSISYSDFVTDPFLSSVDKEIGVKITISDQKVSEIWKGNLDFSHAIFVTDLGRDETIDTLISIEKIVGTPADDILKIDTFNSARLADIVTRQGGVYEIDLGLQVNSLEQRGDLIDLSKCNVGVKVDLSAANPFVSAVSDETSRIIVRGAERVTGSAHNDILIGNGTGVILEGGAGSDQIHLYAGDIGIGGAGVDKFYIYTDRMQPGAPQITDYSKNQVLIIGFDVGDQLYVDGVKYTGAERIYTGDVYMTSGSYNGGDGNGFNFSALHNPDRLNGTVGNALTGRLDIALSAPDKGITVHIAGFEPLDGGIDFRIDYDFLSKPIAEPKVLTFRTDQINFGPEITDIDNMGVFEPFPYRVFDYAPSIESLPTSIASYSTLIDLLN